MEDGLENSSVYDHWPSGLFICEDVAVESSTESGYKYQASVEAPIGSAAHTAAARQGVVLPSDGTRNLEAGFSASRTRTRPQTINAEDKGSSIFAMQLKVIFLKMFNRQALRLQDKSSDALAHR